MILRRLNQHVKDQNWFAVALDFFIVVVGILLAFQITNWNEARGERARGASYLSALAQDIEGDIRDVDEIIRVSTLRMSAMNFLLREASGKALPDGFQSARGRIEIETSPTYVPDDPNTIAIAIFILTTLDGNRLAYDSLISTGDISILRDDELVRDIQAYYADVDKALTFEAALEINRVKLVDAQQRVGLSPVDVATNTELTQTFSDNPALLAAAKNYWLYTNRHLKIMKDLRRDADRLVTRIKNKETQNMKNM